MRATVRPPPDAALPAVAATPSPYRAPPPRRPPETCVNPGRVRPMSRDMSDTSPGTYVLRPDTTPGMTDIHPRHEALLHPGQHRRRPARRLCVEEDLQPDLGGFRRGGTDRLEEPRYRLGEAGRRRRSARRDLPDDEGGDRPLQ